MCSLVLVWCHVHCKLTVTCLTSPSFSSLSEQRSHSASFRLLLRSFHWVSGRQSKSTIVTSRRDQLLLSAQCTSLLSRQRNHEHRQELLQDAPSSRSPILTMRVNPVHYRLAYESRCEVHSLRTSPSVLSCMIASNIHLTTSKITG
jgi:hypothetical protein